LRGCGTPFAALTQLAEEELELVRQKKAQLHEQIVSSTATLEELQGQFNKVGARGVPSGTFFSVMAHVWFCCGTSGAAPLQADKMHQKASAQQAKALSELEKETGMRWRPLLCVVGVYVVHPTRPALLCPCRGRRPARVLKEAAYKEAELAEVMADIAVHETQVKEADEHNAVTARRIDDIKRELDQVRKLAAGVSPSRVVAHASRQPAVGCRRANQAVAMEQELERQIETNRTNVSQSVEMLLNQQRQVRTQARELGRLATAGALTTQVVAGTLLGRITSCGRSLRKSRSSSSGSWRSSPSRALAAAQRTCKYVYVYRVPCTMLTES